MKGFQIRFDRDYRCQGFAIICAGAIELQNIANPHTYLHWKIYSPSKQRVTHAFIALPQLSNLAINILQLICVTLVYLEVLGV